MSKQHYQVATYKTQLSVGYLVKRAHSLMLDIMEPIIEQHGFTFIQYVCCAALRDGIAVNPKDICAQVSSRQRRAHPGDRPAGGARTAGARAPRSRSPQSGIAAHAGRPRRPSKVSFRWSSTSSTGCWPTSARPRFRNSLRLLLKLNDTLLAHIDPLPPRPRR